MFNVVTDTFTVLSGFASVIFFLAYRSALSRIKKYRILAHELAEEHFEIREGYPSWVRNFKDEQLYWMIRRGEFESIEEMIDSSEAEH